MPSTLDGLPTELSRQRVLNSREAAKFVGLSLPHWRRLYRAGKVPRPLQLGERKLGWRIGDLVDFLAVKAAA
jgi:predicted DNA-binding transcriptional regulator AlpA